MARRVIVKVCGITSLEDGRAAAAAGADAVGFVFWERSPRALGLVEARRIAHGLPPFVLRVGVFVDAPAAQVLRTSDEVGLDLVQLHGHESVEDCRAAPRRALKAVGVGPGFEPRTAVLFRDAAAGILLDTRAEGSLPGGTGRRFDWSLARGLRSELPFLGLAGGLDAGNVAAAIREADPDLVDVSSGVESSPGRKDAARIRAFVEAVREVAG
jgi:phosphoribosylanthranilate isomerase